MIGYRSSFARIVLKSVLTTVLLALLLAAAAPLVATANAPGGDYIQCDPRNPASPVRCKPDGW